MSLKKAIANVWGETMNQEGFSACSSGLAYAKVVGEYFAVITFQKMQRSMAFCVNLTLHPRWASAWGRGDTPVNFSTIEEVHCIFFRRLTLAGESDHWFDYDRSADSVETVAREALSLYEMVGSHLMRDVVQRIDSVNNLTFEQFKNGAYDLLGFERDKFWTARSIAERHKSNGNAELAHPFEHWLNLNRTFPGVQTTQ